VRSHNIILNRNVALQGNAELVGLLKAVKFAY
jgi:hypothetical protein